MVVAGATLTLILPLLTSFIITFILCTRKSRNSRRDNLQVQAVNPIEVVYDEIQCYQSVSAPKDQADGVILKDNPAYGELAM